MKQGELYYTGTIVEILDKLLYEIKVDIPGVKSGVTAYPMRGEIDEPRVGDFVFLRCLDPVFQSYYLYHKNKDNDFIGFRSRGKMVDVTPEYIQIAIFNPDNDSWNDFSENTSTDDLGREVGGYRPEVTDWVRIDKNGNLNMYLRNNVRIDVSGSENITIQGNVTLKVNGKTTVQSQNIEIKGPSTLKFNGTCTPVADSNITGGPFVVDKTFGTPGQPIIKSGTLNIS